MYECHPTDGKPPLLFIFGHFIKWPKDKDKDSEMHLLGGASCSFQPLLRLVQMILLLGGALSYLLLLVRSRRSALPHAWLLVHLAEVCLSIVSPCLG